MININDDVFVKIADQEKCADFAIKAISKAIISMVIANTAAKIRVDEQFYELLITEATKFTAKTKISMYVNDELEDSYELWGSNVTIQNTLERLFNDLSRRKAWVEDSISYNGEEGFCWQQGCDKFAITA